MLQSACTGAVTTQTVGVGAANTLQVDIPLKYVNYESVMLSPSWMNENWTYRQAMQIEKTTGSLHYITGHKADSYGVIVGITYNAHMNSDLSDIRFVVLMVKQIYHFILYVMIQVRQLEVYVVQLLL